jgi:hypothetical protein
MAWCAKNKVRARDGALREFDIPPILHIDIKNRPRPWALVKTPIYSRYAVCEYVVLIRLIPLHNISRLLAEFPQISCKNGSALK